MLRAGLIGLSLLALAGCGTNNFDRVSGGSATGAATGATIGLIGGPVGVGVGALIGAGVGGLTGGATTSQQVDLGNPIWDRHPS
jgi:hypothetical protein